MTTKAQEEAEAKQRQSVGAAAPKTAGYSDPKDPKPHGGEGQKAGDDEGKKALDGLKEVFESLRVGGKLTGPEYDTINGHLKALEKALGK